MLAMNVVSSGPLTALRAPMSTLNFVLVTPSPAEVGLAEAAIVQDARADREAALTIARARGTARRRRRSPHGVIAVDELPPRGRS